MISFANLLNAQGSRLLRQPTLSSTHVAFTYGGDLWISGLNETKALRLTSTPAVESNPHFSPDGSLIAFTSNRSGTAAVYVVSIEGGTPTRLTWHPANNEVRGWTVDGKNILYASNRDSAPANFNQLWTVPLAGGPSKMISKQWGNDGSYSPDGKRIVIDRVRRWDVEWRAYRGGQNTPLLVVDLETNEETMIPTEKFTDIQPLWLNDLIYFVSDRDLTANIWSFNPSTKALNQITQFTGSDVKWISGFGNRLVFERDGYLNMLELADGSVSQSNITVTGDFPWAETKWEEVSEGATNASLSPSGKRAIMEARGEIFTIPVENGDTRNVTQSSGAADRRPIWSPNGGEIAWFSDQNGKGYNLQITDQNGLSKVRSIPLGESKLAWEPIWSPDGNSIAFVDDDVRIKVIDIKTGVIKTVDVGGTNLERGRMGISWSPDSKWLAYAKAGSNSFRQLLAWSATSGEIKPLTNSFADAFSPTWDLDGKHLYFLASTDRALGSGWANTSSMTADPLYAAYVINLKKGDKSPFQLKSDEELVESNAGKSEGNEKDEKAKSKKKGDKGEKPAAKSKIKPVSIDFDGIERRIIPLSVPVRNYNYLASGPKGVVFIAERIPNQRGITLHKFELEKGKSKEFLSGASQVSTSTDGKKMLARIGINWKVIDTSGPSGKEGKSLKVDLQLKLNRTEEWKQIFEEAWRYERDYFYDPNMHGRDWDKVYARYAPLIPFVKHRIDLSYILDQMNGELSVGHSFVFGGDFPSVEQSSVGLLGADLKANDNRWQISRIFTTESWNPELSSPLDEPGLKVSEGNYLVGVNGKELTTASDPYQFLDGTINKQTVLHINNKASFEGSWKITVKPIRSENALRQRAWVEDNRRKVDELSDGKLAYIWVPNTSGAGFVSFNRYFFAQQDKLGAVIDERFNGGGLLDDYMVDLMTRSLRASLTNEVPNGKPMKLPAGILGPKALLINEMAGSGGDFFPWVFRQQKAGPLIGATTWGGLVKSSVHYGLVDGGVLTAPDNAVFDPINNQWIAENEGVTPDIAVRQDTKSLQVGRDPQLERAVKEVLKMVEQQPKSEVKPPKFSTPATGNKN